MKPYPSSLGSADSLRGTEVKCRDEGPLDACAFRLVGQNVLNLKHIKSNLVLHVWHLQFKHIVPIIIMILFSIANCKSE